MPKTMMSKHVVVCSLSLQPHLAPPRPSFGSSTLAKEYSLILQGPHLTKKSADAALVNHLHLREGRHEQIVQ